MTLVAVSFTFFMEKNRRRNAADCEQLVKMRLENAAEPIVFSQNLLLEEHLTGIMANIYSRSLVAEDRTRAQFILLFAELFSLFDDQESTVYEYEGDAVENDTRIFMIEEYFNEYYMEPISLKNLAERLYLSEKQTDKEIREIAEEVGYQSYNGFYLTFKEKVGMTPGAYRAQLSSDRSISSTSSASIRPPFS